MADDADPLSGDPAPRPGDLARLLLAAGGEPPRQRARDQQADRAGADLRRRVLDRLARIDPEPDHLDAALLQIIAELGDPSGPTRGVCTSLRQDWDAARLGGGLVAFLIDEALRPEAPEGRGRRRRGPDPTP